MVAESDLDDFLTQLHARRLGLLAAGAQRPDEVSDELFAELAELGEQLLVADEELRTQQDELEAAREALIVAQARSDQLFGSSSTAYLLTDAQGVILESNRAALHLLAEPSPPRTSRPIATKFTVEYRRRIRSMLSQAKLSPESAATPIEDNAALARLDGGIMRVRVRVVPVVDGQGDTAFSWELIPAPAAVQTPPRAVEDESPPSAGYGVLSLVSELSSQLAGQQTPQQVLEHALDMVLDALDGAEEVSISLLHKGELVHTPAATGPLALACDRAQYELDEGPCLETLWEGGMSVIEDMAAETRWPKWTQRARHEGAGSLLACHLSSPGGVLGAVNVYSRQPRAFDAADGVLLPALAVHVAVALARAESEVNLTRAIESRQIIGQAVGILMERHRLSATASFELLVKASQTSNVKLSEIAHRVSETGQEPRAASHKH